MKIAFVFHTQTITELNWNSSLYVLKPVYNLVRFKVLFCSSRMSKMTWYTKPKLYPKIKMSGQTFAFRITNILKIVWTILILPWNINIINCGLWLSSCPQKVGHNGYFQTWDRKETCLVFRNCTKKFSG